MAFHLLTAIRRRSREEWRSVLSERFTDARIFVQENGELSAFVALFVGIFLVLFIEIFSVLLALAVIVCFSIFMLAPTQEDLERAKEMEARLSSTLDQAQTVSQTHPSERHGTKSEHTDRKNEPFELVNSSGEEKVD